MKYLITIILSILLIFVVCTEEFKINKRLNILEDAMIKQQDVSLKNEFQSPIRQYHYTEIPKDEVERLQKEGLKKLGEQMTSDENKSTTSFISTTNPITALDDCVIKTSNALKLKGGLFTFSATKKIVDFCNNLTNIITTSAKVLPNECNKAMEKAKEVCNK